MGRAVGIILDGLVQVGQFEALEDQVLSRVSLNSDYLNLTQRQTNRKLEFLWVEEKEANFFSHKKNVGYGYLRLIEDIWHDGDQVKFAQAEFVDNFESLPN